MNQIFFCKFESYTFYFILIVVISNHIYDYLSLPVFKVINIESYSNTEVLTVILPPHPYTLPVVSAPLHPRWYLRVFIPVNFFHFE